MNRNVYTYGFLVVCTFLVVGAASARRGNPLPQNVFVTNSSSNPVPVSVGGTTSTAIVGVPSVHAYQAGNYYTHLVGDSPVVVTNSTANSLPTTIENTPSVTVANLSGSPIPTSITGTPSVSISGSPTVAVGNSSSSPVPVLEVGAGDSTSTASNGAGKVLQLVGGASQTGGTGFYVVPSGMTFVVKCISVISTDYTGSNQSCASYANIYSGLGFVNVALTPAGDGLSSIGNLAGPALLVVPPGATIDVNAYRNPANTSDNAFVEFSFGGNLIPTPPPAKAGSRK